MANFRNTELWAFSIKIKGQPLKVETSRRWAKFPERTKDWRSLRAQLQAFDNIEAIQFSKVTPRY